MAGLTGARASGSANVARNTTAQEEAARLRIRATLGKAAAAKPVKKPTKKRPTPSRAPVRSTSSAPASSGPVLRARTTAENRRADTNARVYRQSPAGRAAAARPSQADMEFDRVAARAGKAGKPAGQFTPTQGAIDQERLFDVSAKRGSGVKLSKADQDLLAESLRQVYAQEQTGEAQLAQVEKMPGLRAARAVAGTPGVPQLSSGILTAVDTLDRPNYALGQLAEGNPRQALTELYGRGGQRKKKYLSQVVGERVGYASDHPAARFLQDVLVDVAPGLAIPSVTGATRKATTKAMREASLKAARDTREYARRVHVPGDNMLGGEAGVRKFRPEPSRAGYTEAMRKGMSPEHPDGLDTRSGVEAARRLRDKNAESGQTSAALRQQRATRLAGGRRGPDLITNPNARKSGKVKPKRKGGTVVDRKVKQVPITTARSPLIGGKRADSVMTMGPEKARASAPTRNVVTEKRRNRTVEELPYVPAKLQPKLAKARLTGSSAQAARLSADRGKAQYIQVGRGQMARKIQGRVERATDAATNRALRAAETAGARRTRVVQSGAAAVNRAENRVGIATTAARASVGQAKRIQATARRDLAATRATMPKPGGNYRLKVVSGETLVARRAKKLRVMERRAARIDNSMLRRSKSGHYSGELADLARQREAAMKAQAQREGAGEVIGEQWVNRTDVGYTGKGSDTSRGAGQMQHNPRRKRNDLTRLPITDQYGRVRGSRPKKLSDYAAEILEELRTTRDRGGKLTDDERSILDRADQAGVFRDEARKVREEIQGEMFAPIGERRLGDSSAGAVKVGPNAGARGTRARNAERRGGTGPVPKAAQPVARTPRARHLMRSVFTRAKGEGIEAGAKRARRDAEAAIDYAQRQQDRFTRTVQTVTERNRAARVAEDRAKDSLLQQATSGAKAVAKAGKEADKETPGPLPRITSPAQLQRLTVEASEARKALMAAQKAMYRESDAAFKALHQRRPSFKAEPFGNANRLARFLEGPALTYLEVIEEARLNAPVGVYVNVPFTRESVSIPLVLPSKLSKRLRSGVGNLRVGPANGKSFTFAQIAEWSRYMGVSQYGPNRVAGGLIRYADDYFTAHNGRAIERIMESVKKHEIWDPKDRILATHYLEGTVPEREVPKRVRAFADEMDQEMRTLFNEAKNAGVPVTALNARYVYHVARDNDDLRKLDNVFGNVQPGGDAHLGYTPSFIEKREWLTVREAQDAGFDMEDDLGKIVAMRAAAHYRAMSDKSLSEVLSKKFGMPSGGKEVEGPWFKDMNRHLPDDVWETVKRAQEKRERIFASKSVRAMRRWNSTWKKMALLYVGYDVRNQMGDMFLLAQQGRNPFAGFAELKRTLGKSRDKLDGFLTHEEMSDLAQNLGITGRGITSGDYYRIDNPGAGFSTSKVARADRGIQKFRQARENMNRRGAMQSQMKYGPLAAADESNRVLFDYKDVGRAVDFMRTSGVSPFITWTAKNAPRQAGALIRHPKSVYFPAMVNRNAEEEDPRFSWAGISSRVRDQMPQVVPSWVPVIGGGAVAWGNPQSDLRRVDPTRGWDAISRDLGGDLGPILKPIFGAMTGVNPSTGAQTFNDPRRMTPLERLLTGITGVGQGGDAKRVVDAEGNTVAAPTTNALLAEILNLVPPLRSAERFLPELKYDKGKIVADSKSGRALADRGLSFGAGLSRTDPTDPGNIARLVKAKKAELLDLRMKRGSARKANNLGGIDLGTDYDTRVRRADAELRALIEWQAELRRMGVR